MAMTFEAPATLAGPEVAPVLAVFDGDEPTSEVTNEVAIVEQEADAATEGDVVADATVVAAEPVDQPAEPAAVATSETVPADDDTFWEEIALLGKLSEAERERQEAAAQYLSIKEEAKEAKDYLAAKEVALQKVASEIAELMASKTLPTKPQSQIDQAQDQIHQAGEQTAEAAEAVDNSWRLTTTSELLAGLKGLGKKKLETICAVAATVGDLEDLRGEASKAFKPFKDVLPDGFGVAVASAIEDRLIEHIAKFASQSCADQVEPRSNHFTDAIPVITKDMNASEKLAIVDQFDQLRKSMESENEIHLLDLKSCVIGEDDSQQMQEGFDAFEMNRSVHECDADTIDAQRDWVLGWLLAKRKEMLMVQTEKETDAPDSDGISDL